MTTEAATETAIEELVCTWAPSYKCSVRAGSGATWVVTWSKPTPAHPVPLAVARATFEVDPQTQQPTAYRLEGQRLVHHVGQPPHFREAWVDAIIEGKLAAKAVATDFAAAQH
jgi:hypothetical protein